MSIKYEWTTLPYGSCTFTPEDIKTPVDEDIRRAAEAAMKKAIGDFRETLGLSREPSPEELAAENYCYNCGRPYDEDES